MILCYLWLFYITGNYCSSLLKLRNCRLLQWKGKRLWKRKNKLQISSENRRTWALFFGSYCRVLGKGGNCKFLQKKKESADFFLQEIEATAEFFGGWGETVDFFTKYFIFHLIEMKVKPIKDKPDRWNVILFVRASKKLIFILFLMSFLQPRIV